jgi:hypothetical protein
MEWTCDGRAARSTQPQIQEIPGCVQVFSVRHVRQHRLILGRHLVQISVQEPARECVENATATGFSLPHDPGAQDAPDF